MGIKRRKTKESWDIPTMEYYSAAKREELRTMKWIKNLLDITLSGRSETSKSPHRVKNGGAFSSCWRLCLGLGMPPSSTGASLMGKGTDRWSCVPDTPRLGLAKTNMLAGRAGLVCQTGNRARSVLFLLHWLCPSAAGFGPRH